jgi:hypothetical protein
MPCDSATGLRPATVTKASRRTIGPHCCICTHGPRGRRRRSRCGGVPSGALTASAWTVPASAASSPWHRVAPSVARHARSSVSGDGAGGVGQMRPHRQRRSRRGLGGATSSGYCAAVAVQAGQEESCFGIRVLLTFGSIPIEGIRDGGFPKKAWEPSGFSDADEPIITSTDKQERFWRSLSVLPPVEPGWPAEGQGNRCSGHCTEHEEYEYRRSTHLTAFSLTRFDTSARCSSNHGGLDCLAVYPTPPRGLSQGSGRRGQRLPSGQGVRLGCCRHRAEHAGAGGASVRQRHISTTTPLEPTRFTRTDRAFPVQW